MTTAPERRMTVTILSVRMTTEEKARLESEADHAGMKLSAYVRRQLLGPDRPRPRNREPQQLDRPSPRRVTSKPRLASSNPQPMSAYERLLAEQQAKRR